ncbi:hypothetical protein K474DRAFT_1636658 [Panus rudis PR-1116 ss-1]|nr:hypothetical protein K474DRAFT_1636658 [Panus rudis PR-1116 ss-1]
MSRIPTSARSTPSSPTKSQQRPLSRTAGTPSRSRAAASPTPTPTLRGSASVKNLRSGGPSKASAKKPAEEPPLPIKPQLSIKEQIALKRAEAQKAKAAQGKGSGGGLDLGGLEDALPVQPQEDVLDLGRWSVKETIERGRSSGAINLASRALPCLPSALFEIHLGIKPEPLKSVPVEPPITTATADDPVAAAASRRRARQEPSWFEAQDLEVLKAWSNEIIEIQPEINLFGSLKTIDLHNNKLTALPETFADLTALTILDLSHNNLTSLPTNFWALPALTTLNLSHNHLTSLPFSKPFKAEGSTPLGRIVDPRGDWYGVDVVRASKPLPKLSSLDVSHNRISASSIDHGEGAQWLPEGVTKVNLSYNPLGRSVDLIRALSRLSGLQELNMEHADIGNDSFPVDLLPPSPTPFPRLSVFSLEETNVTKPAIEASFLRSTLGKEIDFEVTNEPPKSGILRVIVGKRIVKEPWEIEAERRAKARGARHTPSPATVESDDFWGTSLGSSDRSKTASSNRNLTTTQNPVAAASTSNLTPKRDVQKEPWEIDAEQGLLTEGAKRRARALAAAAAASPSIPEPSVSAPRSPSKSSRQTNGQIEKEPWEIEAEQGLLTAGGRRRARAAAMAASLSVSDSSPTTSQASSTAVSPTAPSHHANGNGHAPSSAMSDPRYYDAANQTLTLPPSVAPSKGIHARSFSLAPARSAFGAISISSSDLALAIPTPTLPLASIFTQSYASTLKVLVLSNRRMDPSFSLPAEAEQGPFLPVLEELTMENCNLGDTVPVSRNPEDPAAPRTNEALLPLLARLFPSLRTLDLSYNHLTNAALSGDILSSLILAYDGNAEHNDGGASPLKMGLRHLRLRGNKLTDLDGFLSVTQLFKGHKDGRDVPSWKLEELDVRDNEITKLTPELGLLPLDVLLVDGNVFRVPPRRVWEREGTKGLLSWLRGRME